MFDNFRKKLSDVLTPKREIRFIGTQTPGVPVYTDMTVQKATREGYKISVYVYRAVRTIIQAASAIPWVVIKDGEIIDGHPLSQVIANPNKEFSGQDLMEYTIAYLELVGNALWQPIIVGGRVREIWPVLPDVVQPVPSDVPGEWMKGWQVTNNGRMEILPSETFIHFQQINPGNPYWGISPLMAAARTIDTDNEAQDTQKVSMQNRGVADGAFIHESPLTPEQFEEARRQIKENYLARSRRREPWILGAGTKWQPMSITPVEMDFIASRIQNKRDIAAAFGISPIFLGDLEQSSYDNMQQARKSLYEDVVIPLLDDLKSTINLKLAHLYGDITLTYDLSNVPALREDYGKKVEQAARLWSMGVPFEQINAKLEMGFDEFPGWDVGYLPLSLLPTGYSGSSEEKQFKAIETEDAKVQYWKRLDRRRIGWWGAAEKKILPLFENEKDEVLKAIKSGDPMTAAENAITKQKDKWLEVMTAITTAIVEDFGNDIAQDLGAERKWRFDPFKPAAMQWIIGHAADSVTTILNTNKNDIKNIILRGMADNLPTPDIADEISKFYNDRSEYKSMRIARTEVAAASGYGSLEAARQSGIVERKKWLSSRDDRVRDSHQAIDGEEVPLDGTFSNGCEAPGVGGDPAETIQCRCVLQFVTRRT